MNVVQFSIMQSVEGWVRANKRPVPFGFIASELGIIPKNTVKYSIRALVKAGYLRKSVVRSNTVSYVQLRSL